MIYLSVRNFPLRVSEENRYRRPKRPLCARDILIYHGGVVGAQDDADDEAV